MMKRTAVNAPDAPQPAGSYAQAIILVAPQTGTYTVVVASWDVNRIGTGTYELTLTKTP